MPPKLELTESDELGYYTTFKKLFPRFESYSQYTSSKDLIQVNFSYTDEDTAPNKAQLAAHDFFITHSNKILENLITYLKQYEEYFLELYGPYRETSYENVDLNGETRIYTDKDGFPIVDNLYDIINYFGINTINIVDAEEDGISYIGFTGGCTWDTEHGFGFIFHKLELLNVGDWDTGQYFNKDWRTDNQYLLTNAFLKLHCMESLEKRKERLVNLGKSIQVKNATAYEEVFNWLVKHKMIYGYRNSPVDITIKEKIILINEIEELLFWGNEIKFVPDAIYLLENLKSLTFSHTTLEAIPLQLMKLTGLKHLSVSSNKINSIPKEIMFLKSLESLSLNDNKLQSIPEEIVQLTNLQCLDLSSNKLSDLPESFSELNNLEILTLNYNSFTSFPDVILNISSLKNLNLSNNQLTNIPQAITQLKSLEELDLRFNQLTTLPKSLFDQMSNLQQLQIAVNPIDLEDLNHIQQFIPQKIETDLESAIACVIDDLERQQEDTQIDTSSSNLKASDTSDKKWWEFWRKK